MRVEVLIIGAGVAGATAALNLAPLHQVLLVDADAAPRPRIGESLPGASRRLLGHMGLLEGFIADGHMPRHALDSVWGMAALETRHSLRDPDGPGWQIDRCRFERQLRAEAVRRGVQVLAPAHVQWVDHARGRAVIACRGGSLEVTADLILDASGRRSRLMRDAGGHETNQGRLTCFWARSAGADLPAGVVRVVAEPEGWWYAAPLPGCGAILAFHTDADLPAAKATASRDRLIVRARRTAGVAELAQSTAWDHAAFGACAADGHRRARVNGLGWAAVGDAAIAFDPLAAQGLFNALYLGLAAAEAGSRARAGDAGALDGYAGEVDRIWSHYAETRCALYADERRWRDRPFWARRLTPGAPASAQTPLEPAFLAQQV